MRAVAYTQAGPIDHPQSLLDEEFADPVALGRDLLVEIKAVSVNPVDVKVRQSAERTGSGWKTLGWDAAGVVRAVGADATAFRVGDEIFYAGSIARPGSNSELQLVDERIVSLKPRSLDWAEAAALPLTSITAWEALFDRLDVLKPVPGAANAVLIIGGAGGVGSMAIQLARQLTDLTVIATASRSETREWVSGLGAHHVVDHSLPLAPQIEAFGLGAPAFVFSTTHTDQHLADIAELISPQGRFALIDDPATLDALPFKRKSVSLHWELMFTRSLFDTPDIGEQGKLLAEVSRLADAGQLRTTLTERLSPINAANLKTAHRMVESASMRGKVVLEDWG
ncbi:zinc-binding alcohol dehydrogenase family protein [Sphingomonas sp. TREG-RG-20F-R18-01]|uniref:zinc-binding alcohol dehydrogenase family protein n=1 Tax=Sphingomonas sp. TREG-RG-20F-R18-01 TaxID=2914982 RepID=UPI001F57558D|nr:zinc-binding alcohol dehydrogenase family protein [Sphingomonas sp. TREG-RG-20F-R18-01]